jgi:hypothetical protein
MLWSYRSNDKLVFNCVLAIAGLFSSFPAQKFRANDQGKR